jgi:DNA-binding response OmpR family regulator
VLHRLADQPPSSIVLNLDCPSLIEPQGNGLECLRFLKVEFPQVPVLTLTHQPSLEQRITVVRFGGDRYLTKPTPAPQILAAIAQVLPQAKAPDAKVLILDDDPIILDLLAGLLQPWGIQTVTLENPAHFWEALTATEPDLVILDLEMPDFNGTDLCRVVRQDLHWGDLPILVVTAHTNTDSIQQMFAAGADDFIGKPVVGPELVTRVLSRVERWRKQSR